MARSVSSAGILRLPPAAAALLFSAVFGLTSGHVLPRQTKTVELHELNVVPFPRPTEAPVLLSDLLLRRQGQNTVCGFIGGDPNLPATCSAGSHCVLEQDHGVVGCCPDGGSCSTGIFTGCVDRNSDLQTEINPYVYTCQGSDVCYRNRFAGGYFQFGCGTASSLGTTVETSVDGMTSLVFEETAVSLTALPSVLTEPTSIGSQPSSATDGADPDPAPSGSDTTSPDSPEPSAIVDPTPTSDSSQSSPQSSPTAAAEASGTNRGAIIGGSISGAAVLVAIIVALALYFLRKRRGNNRQGPGPLPTDAPPRTDYISPMTNHGAVFPPLPPWQDEEEDRRPLTQYTSPPYRPLPEPPRPQAQQVQQMQQAQTGMAPARTAPTPRAYSQPLRYHPPTIRLVPPTGPVGTGLTPVAEEETPQDQDSSSGSDREYESSISRGPTPSEIDDFSRAYMSAGIGTQDLEEDRLPLREGAESPGGSQSPPRGGGAGGNRPLWQQNRQQTRNLMWL
ncbi:hypothetical protein Daesc_010394 [Daldinia eschscholtzii]|uniref:Uncharacterized protein n=1 Tax=Daldinia eschscholtzii TaxID=292717 RepID=A0AAX6M851_9PEZI